MWLGSLRCHLGKHAPFHIAWPEEYVFALGVAFAYDPTTSYRINFEEKFVTLKNVLNQWTTMNLTLLESLYGGQFTLSTPLIKPNFCILLPHRRSTTVSLETTPSLIGRICIVKTLAISKLVYNTSVFTVPPNFPEKVNDICFKFIWNFNPIR